MAYWSLITYTRPDTSKGLVFHNGTSGDVLIVHPPVVFLAIALPFYKKFCFTETYRLDGAVNVQDFFNLIEVVPLTIFPFVHSEAMLAAEVPAAANVFASMFANLFCLRIIWHLNLLLSFASCRLSAADS